MADPLSVAAGVAGLLSLGIQVTTGLIGFYTSWKDQDINVARTAKTLEFLLSTFQSLDTTLRARQFRPDEHDLLQKVEGAILECEEIIKELQGEFKKFDKISASDAKGKVKVSARRITYPLRRGTLMNLEDNVTEIRENMSFALDLLQLKDHKAIQEEFSGLKSLFECVNATQISSAIRDWLMAPDATINHNAACRKRHTRTGLWFINGQQFTSWLTESNSFLWINGFAGCGKSILCSTAIQNTFRTKQTEQGVGIAFFYFDFNDTSKQNDSGMLRALLLQLSGQLKNGEKDLQQLYTSYNPGAPPVEALIAYLRRTIQRFHNTYILLDALDESPRYHQRENVLTTLEVMRKWCLPGVHLLVTSRDEFDIRGSLSPKRDQDIIMRSTEIDRDISSFVMYRLNSDSNFQWSKAHHSKIQGLLTERAKGVFRYVECQLNSLKRARNGVHLDKCLNSLPCDLAETYERLLCGIDEIHIHDVRRILTILCFSNRPLTIAELIHAHAVEIDDPPLSNWEDRLLQMDDIRDISLGLIEIARNKDERGQETLTVHIAHFSVQEYLLSDRIERQKAAVFALKSGPAHTEIAQICLAYLLQPRFSSGEVNEETILEFPLTHFAAQNWYHHYTNSQDGKCDVENLVLKLFRNHRGCFSTWIRLHDVERPWLKLPEFQRPIDDIPSPLHYASLLGFARISNEMIDIGFDVNGQGGRHANTLQAASSGGHTQVVQILLERGADVNAQGGYYGNALQASSYGGYENVVQILLAHGANVNAQGGSFGNALQASSYGGYETVVQILLVHGANVNAQGGLFGNALQASSYGGYETIVRILLAHGADVNIETQGRHFYNALQAASYRGHERVVQILLEQGADIHAQGGDYGSAIQATSYGGHEKVVQILLEQGADIHAQGGDYGSALQAASYGGHERVVQILLEQGADIHAQGGDYGSALQAASYGGHERVVRILLEQGIDIHAQGGVYGNALQAASYRGHERVVQTLLGQGVDVNTQGGHFGNALQAASYGGHERVVQILLGQGVDVNAQGGHFGSALQGASHGGHEKVILMLLEWVADINAEHGTFNNALQAASAEGHERVVQILLAQGADVNTQGGHYGNALQATSYRGHDKVAQILLAQGANVNAQGGEYGSALKAASYRGHKKVMQILLEWGADVNT
ncbi:unnamed protein product [Penicillium egyptiacum]|uniref:NACHT domain-containing protein n=1 Tax=Penicillium egyptiacum TaxID=1303716 RepID=A0A9W4KCN3_9EURO|nr:unnamed protein product [Penicillium egyptiacum]